MLIEYEILITKRAQVVEHSFLVKDWYRSQSKIEVEYVVVVVNCSNIVWFTQFLEGMKVEIKEPVVMFYDNTSAINISKNAFQNQAYFYKVSLCQKISTR